MAPPSGIEAHCLIRPTKQSSTLVAPIHNWLRYLILIFQYIVAHIERIHFSPHKHRWALPMSTCYDVTHPVESQYHTMKFLSDSLHFCFSCRVNRNSFRHRLQKSLLMCWILLHLLRQYRSGLPNTPRGSITNLDFTVKMWLGDTTTSLLTLLIVSTTIGLELTMPSTSANKWLIIEIHTVCSY